MKKYKNIIILSIALLFSISIFLLMFLPGAKYEYYGYVHTDSMYEALKQGIVVDIIGVIALIISIIGLFLFVLTEANIIKLPKKQYFVLAVVLLLLLSALMFESTAAAWDKTNAGLTNGSGAVLSTFFAFISSFVMTIYYIDNKEVKKQKKKAYK